MDIFILSMEIWYVKELELVSSLSLALCSILLHVHVSLKLYWFTKYFVTFFSEYSLGDEYDDDGKSSKRFA